MLRLKEMVDRFVVIQSAKRNPERAGHFPVELEKIGVTRFDVIDPVPIEDTVSWIDIFGLSRRGKISLILTLRQVISKALTDDVSILCIIEDDVIFRERFEYYWSQISDEICKESWGVCVLHRTSSERNGVIFDRKNDKVEITKIYNNLNTHLFIVRRAAFVALDEALASCLKNGWAADFFYGIFSSRSNNIIIATTKNLTGQKGGFSSGIRQGYRRPETFPLQYFAYRNWVEYFAYKCMRSLRRIVKSLK